MSQLRFQFRCLEQRDLPQLHEWLNRPHVAERWEGLVSLEEVAEHYGEFLSSEIVKYFFAFLGGIPIGFIQSYHVMSADPDWWKDETDPGAWGIDQFLANASQLGQGLGTQMIAEFVELLFCDPKVTQIQTDPTPDNTRAIRSYEKAGFIADRIVETPDGPALLMVIKRKGLG